MLGQMNRIYGITDKPLVIAHRGGGDEHPENSIVAFRAAYQAGFRYIETDAHATSDGVAVLSHDPMLDRTTDGSGLISAHTWKEITQVHDESGNCLMRVDDVLAEFPDVVFNIDAKEDNVAMPLVDAIRRTHAQTHVCVASFSEKRLDRIRYAMPTLTTSLGVTATARMVIATHVANPLRGQLLRAVPGPADGAQAVQVPLVSRHIPVLTQKFVQIAHAHQLAVHAWTINDLDQADLLVSWGVDGIITDQPTAMRAHLAQA
jgi:glycerophosphoryl diester phosphodiesterase